MFRNTLTGLSKYGKEVFDRVCIHLNGLMQSMGIKYLDGEEDQILLDLWMDTFPFKQDADGNFVFRKVPYQVVEYEPVVRGTKRAIRKGVEVDVPNVVGGRKVVKTLYKEVRELDFSHSLLEETPLAIYIFRAEQLFLNRVRYLYGDKRVRAKVWDEAKQKMVPATVVTVDSCGKVHKRALWESVNDGKVSKRDLSKTITESALSRDGEDEVTIADITPSADVGLEEALLLYDASRVCDEVEMQVVRKFLDGDSTNMIFKDFDRDGIKFSARRMEKLKNKLRELFSSGVLA